MYEKRKANTGKIETGEKIQTCLNCMQIQKKLHCIVQGLIQCGEVFCLFASKVEEKGHDTSPGMPS